MAFCTKCGEQFGSEDRFCASCGAPASPGPETSESAQPDSSPKKEPEMVRVGSTRPDATVITGKHLGLFIAGAVIIVLFFAWFGTGFGGLAVESPTIESQPTEAPKPTPEEDTWDNDISRDDCAVILAQTDYILFSYEGNSYAGSSYDLTSASSVFTQIAGSYSGSDRDWLLKMAELATGVAQGNDRVVTPLKANLGLADQFCG